MRSNEPASPGSSDRPKRTWRELWEVGNRAYAAEEERGRQRHAARQDRLRDGATSVEIREAPAGAIGRILRRTPLAIALAIGAVWLGRIGFTGILDNIGDPGVPLLANLAGVCGALVFGSIALRLAVSVVELIVRVARNTRRAAADERGLTLATDLEGDLPPEGGPVRLAWSDVRSLTRSVTYECRSDEDPSPPPRRSPEHLVVTTHDGRVVRTLVDGPRKPWQRLMLVARDVGRVVDVTGIDGWISHYTDTDPYRLRFGR